MKGKLVILQEHMQRLARAHGHGEYLDEFKAAFSSAYRAAQNQGVPFKRKALLAVIKQFPVKGGSV